MNPPDLSLTVFVATRAQDVPAGCVRFVSVDGSVPGATVTWDHHVTGEDINLDAMPPRFDMTGFDGVGTTMADTDAVASVVAVLFGGKANLPPHVLDLLSSASYRCDHLLPHPKLSDEVNERGRGVHGHITLRIHSGPGAFATVCRELATLIFEGKELPSDTRQQDAQRALARALEADGRIRVVGKVALVDLRGRDRVDPEALYELISAPVSVVVEEHPRGGLRYTVGVNPRVEDRPSSLRRALELLATAEHAHGAPSASPIPGPGSENWGGRATVFGSPWNYGSRLSVDEVLRWVEEGIEGPSPGIAASAKSVPG